MPDLNALMVFARVVEATSFTIAAKRLSMPISTVSRKVAELEDQLGVRLLERSTRSLRLTDIGSEVYQQAQRSLEIDDAVASIVSNQLSEVKGSLKISAPPSISDNLLSPLIGAFQASYPQVRINVLVTDRFVDHISEGVDLVIRVGAMKDSSLIARKLLRYRHVLVASPEYLEDHPMPQSPSDLLDHRLHAFSFWSATNNWTFSKGEETETISFQPHLTMNDYVGLARALLKGGGIGDLPPIVLPALMAEGQLVEVMPDWKFPARDLSIVHLGNRHISRPVRLFKEFAAQMAPSLFPVLPQ